MKFIVTSLEDAMVDCSDLKRRHVVAGNVTGGRRNSEKNVTGCGQGPQQWRAGANAPDLSSSIDEHDTVMKKDSYWKTMS
eukprot:scaffold41649_cov33-Attheya_sp.AAC.2